VQYFRRKMDSADSGDRPTVELFVKVSLFEPRAWRQSPKCYLWAWVWCCIPSDFTTSIMPRSSWNLERQ